MPVTDVRLRGVGRLQRTLGHAIKELEDMAHANQEAASVIAAAASTRAPRVTGALASSLAARRTKARGEVTSSVPYAIVINYGYPPHNISPSGFIERAADETQDQWVGVYDTDLQRIANTVQGA